jgi:hypothetical protein
MRAQSAGACPHRSLGASERTQNQLRAQYQAFKHAPTQTVTSTASEKNPTIWDSEKENNEHSHFFFFFQFL